MRAAQIQKYSKKIQVELNDVDMPQINNHEVLVKVKAAGVNPLDILNLNGSVRMIADYKLPLTLGNELSGVIEAVGDDVLNFKVGDPVYTRLPLNKIGAFAEYAAVNEDALSIMPENLSFIEAAAVPLTALTAYQALHDVLHVQPNKKLFIPGGTGGFGAMAIPIAKSLGLFVITSGSERGRSRILSIGADQFINYKAENYANILSDIDYVIDTLGTKEIKAELGILKPQGKLVSLKAGPNYRFAVDNRFPLWKKALFGLVGARLDSLARKNQNEYHFLFVQANGSQLQDITKLVEQKNIKPSIDSAYTFGDINKALIKVSTGHSQGKVIVTF
ncbi:NADP-dependent oxidoreductase [Paenibacillus polymyxa]|uniref:NADP-dependent oxidoreductase n=1 Tax=Paenibacillus polymyxa TaxID=1406 RepID=A0A8I1LQV5_PAEPO|nr:MULTISPECIES: NADP-dependent oxidoreductase [Paenibacillus]KAF6574816.1 NADP-dependent oxidoreductase [Paenibacillus sp. EKM206P]KAF6590511.1 NADP-dependent oxidoreductase [Paenibacillus sp. EKM205P]MBM0634059.1 NADP-dependent oxidoreductase [Paenibacillus polymyxa]